MPRAYSTPVLTVSWQRRLETGIWRHWQLPTRRSRRDLRWRNGLLVVRSAAKMGHDSNLAERCRILEVASNLFDADTPMWCEKQNPFRIRLWVAPIVRWHRTRRSPKR